MLILQAIFVYINFLEEDQQISSKYIKIYGFNLALVSHPYMEIFQHFSIRYSVDFSKHN